MTQSQDDTLNYRARPGHAGLHVTIMPSGTIYQKLQAEAEEPVQGWGHDGEVEGTKGKKTSGPHTSVGWRHLFFEGLLLLAVLVLSGNLLLKEP